MPTYQYQCKNCGFELEDFQSITAPPLTHCPKCNQETLARVMGTGAGLIFKGSGFYLTDYKKSNMSVSKGSPAKESKAPEAPATEKKEDSKEKKSKSKGETKKDS